MVDKIQNIIFLVFVFIFIFALIFCFYCYIKHLYEKCIANVNEYKNTHDYSTATVIDNHIGYRRFGTPCYFLVYKFSSGIIEQKRVSAEEYYKYVEGMIYEVK